MAKHASIRDFRQALDRLSVARLGVCFGSCSYLVDRGIAAFMAAGPKDALSSSLEANSLSAEQWTSLLEQPSIFEPKTNYLLRRCDRPAKLKELIEIFFATPSTHRALLVTSTETLPSEIAQLSRQQQLAVIPCLEPWPNEIPALAEDMLKAEGLLLGRDALHALLAHTGPDPMLLFNEIKKLKMIFRQQEGSLGAQDLAPYLGLLREDDAFALSSLLLKREWNKAHALLVSLLARGTEPLPLLGVIAAHCRHAIRIAVGTSQGRSPRDLAQEIRLPPSVFREYSQSCYRQSPTPYLRCLARCRETDTLLKSQRIDPGLLLARLIDSLALA